MVAAGLMLNWSVNIKLYRTMSSVNDYWSDAAKFCSRSTCMCLQFMCRCMHLVKNVQFI